MKALLFYVCIVLLLIPHCKAQVNSTKLVVLEQTTFYNRNQDVSFVGKIKIWQKNSLFIEQVYLSKSLTTADKITTREHVPLFCHFINLKNHSYYRFHSFSDTSRCFRKGVLSDTVSKDGGFPFYSEKLVELNNEPILLTDSIIAGNIYHRIRFYTKYDDTATTFSVGLFLDGQPFGPLSLEKKFSKSRDWFLSKILDCNKATGHPYAIREIEFLSYTLSPEEERVFDAWEEYARKNPVVQ